MANETDRYVFRAGTEQHFLREQDNRYSRLIFRGELAEVRR